MILLLRTTLDTTYHRILASALTSSQDCVGSSNTHMMDGGEMASDEEEEVENSIDVDADEESASSRAQTTLSPIVSTATMSGTLLPLCSEVTSSEIKIGSGLLSKFGVSTTTSMPAPCRQDERLGPATTEAGLDTETTTTAGSLFQQLAEKFG